MLATSAVLWNVLSMQTGTWKQANPSPNCKRPQVENTHEAVSPSFSNLSLRGPKDSSKVVQNGDSSETGKPNRWSCYAALGELQDPQINEF